MLARADGNTLTIVVDKRWHEQRSLLREDLSGEPKDAADLGVELRIEPA